MKTKTPKPIRLKSYRPPAWLIDRVDLDIVLHETRTEVRSRLSIRPADTGVAEPLRFDGEQIQLAALALDRRALGPRDYTLTDTSLTIHAPPSRRFTLDVGTIVDPSRNTALQGLYRSRGVYCTQCEAHGFRRITYFLDRPDVLSEYRVRLEADLAEAPILLSNGNPVERGTVERGRRHYAVWHDPFPKPCYLFALVGGDLSSIASTFTTMTGRSVDLRIYVEHGKEARAGWAMDSLKRAMAWDERAFGREYDLDVFNIVAVSDFNMGAMENKGLNIFNDRLILASPETATDTIFEAIESVVAHEYFHNWTGNRITCRDWFQLCLKEGLTVFRDQEFSGHERSATVQRIADVRQLKAQQFAEDAGPLAHPVRPDTYIEINNFYTATVYEKGAELVRMIRTILGEQAFRAGMDLYFSRHDGQAATVEDFIAAFEDAAQRDLSQFMLWYQQAGTPSLVCSFRYDRRTKTAALEVEQISRSLPGKPRPKPLHIPLRIGLIGPDGDDMELVLEDGAAVANGVLDITRRKQRFRFVGLQSKPVPSLLRGFSAPVDLAVDLDVTDLEFLMAHDSDLFNRWQAANAYATRLVREIVRGMAEGKRRTRGQAYANGLAAIILNRDLEPAYRAEALRLPSEADIAREIGRDIDPGLIHRARRQLIRLVATCLGRELEALYDELRDKGRFSPAPSAAGRRALRNAALTLLVGRGTAADTARAWSHFAGATNMTDEAHALVLLAGVRCPEREQALARFHQRWQHDHVVIDTWFAAQAQAPFSSTLADVARLLHHPQLSLTSPNKVRALIGTFALHNPVQFNRPDGQGYAFVADQVLAIDRLNPQIAARLLGAFRSWRALEPGRRKLARKALTRVSRASQLSPDVYEILSKMLDE